MLVLSRKKNESTILTAGPFRIVVTVIEIRGDKVRIGYSAAPEVIIHREEVQKAIDIDNEKAEMLNGKP